MSTEAVIRFFAAACDDPPLVGRFNTYALPELLFHAGNLGYHFSPRDLASVVGPLEYTLVTERFGETFDGSSRLWPQMWGVYHFEYVIDRLARNFTAEEMRSIVARLAPQAATPETRGSSR